MLIYQAIKILSIFSVALIPIHPSTHFVSVYLPKYHNLALPGIKKIMDVNLALIFQIPDYNNSRGNGKGCINSVLGKTNIKKFFFSWSDH